MSKEIKRVPLDFDWPIGEVWPGFLNSHSDKPCPERDKTCFNGLSADRQWLDRIVAFIQTVAESGRRSKDPQQQGRLDPHPYLVQFAQHPYPSAPRKLSNVEYCNKVMYGFDPSNTVTPTEQFWMFWEKLTGGHLNIGPWNLEKMLMEKAGLDPETWGICPVCKGENIDPAVQEAHDAWKETEPPAGTGWQVWETVSEGSPTTPVFPTSEALIDHLCTKGDSWYKPERGDKLPSRKAATNFVNSGWVPSAVMIGGVLKEDIHSAE